MISSLLPLIESFNNRHQYSLIPFWFEGNVIGYLGEKVAHTLMLHFSSLDINPRIQFFEKDLSDQYVDSSANQLKEWKLGLELVYHHQDTSKSMRTALTQDFEDKILSPWRNSNLFTCLKGWRNERYSIFAKNGSILFDVERAAVGLFGFRTYGCHLNGYTINEKNGEMKMWIAKRSLQKQTDPGKLDNIAAGGLGSRYGIFETMIKEAEEEAGIPYELARHAKHVGTISYYEVRGDGIENEPGTDYCFDLVLPNSFIPTPQDGEVDSFQLLSLDSIVQLMLDNQFKPESMVVLVDFMVRHGYLTSESPDYLDICCALRVKSNLPPRSLLI